MSDEPTPDPRNSDPQAGEPAPEMAGLERLLPEVDEETAAATFVATRSRRFRQRRGLQVVVAAVVVLVVGLLAASLVGNDNGTDEVVVAGPDPADTTTGDPDDDHAPGDPDDVEVAEVSTTGHGVEMTLSAPAAGRVGELLEVTVTVRNTSDEPIGLGSGSACDPGASVTLRPRDAGDGGGGGGGGEWDGELDTLTAHLTDQSRSPTLDGRSPDDVWTRFSGCTGQLVAPEVIEPGSEIEVDLVVPLRWGLSEVPAQMELHATSSNLDLSGQESIGEVPEGPQLTAALQVTMVDDPARAGSVEDVLGPDGLVGAPGLADWLELSTPNDSWNVAPGVTLEQTWRTDLHWWDGLWVLWIDPEYLDGNITGPLRIQYDPERGEVIDVRSVAAGNGGSADDPGAPPDYPPDTIIYQAD